MAPKTKRSKNISSAPNAAPGLNFNHLVDRLPCYVFIQDRDLQIINVNEAFKDGDMPLARKGWQIVNKNIFGFTDFVKNTLYSSNTAGESR